jgi:mRNA interferase MazF
MTSYNFGDVVLVPFPFTDQTGTKKRPAVVVSSATYNSARLDLILMAITSQLKTVMTVGEVAVDDWHKAGLLKPSNIKPVRTTVEKRMVLRRVGQLEEADRISLQQTLRAPNKTNRADNNCRGRACPCPLRIDNTRAEDSPLPLQLSCFC